MSKVDTQDAAEAVPATSKAAEDKEDFDKFAGIGWEDGEDAEDKTIDEKGNLRPASHDDAEDDDTDESASDEDDGESEDTDAADKADSEEEKDDAAEDEEDSADSEKDDAKKEDTDLEAERKQHNHEMALARQEAKKAREDAAEVAKKAREVEIERYLDEAKDDVEERARRENVVDTYRIKEERIDLNTQQLEVGIDKAAANIDLFRTKNPVIKERLAQAVDDFELKFVVKDKNGRPAEIKIDPATGKPADVYQYLVKEADSIRKLTGVGARDQGKSKSKEKTRTMTPPGRAPKKAKADPMDDGFDEEAKRY